MERLERLFECMKVMSVNPENVTAECRKLCIDRRGVHNICRRAVDLKSVHVHRNAEIVQLVVCGKHRRLPHLPLGKLTVSKQCIDVDILPQILRPLCHADRR